MNKTKIFIDGKEGTTGLRIFERLSNRDDIEIITLSEEMRKDTAARKQALNSCDIAFLCLPDAAAIEAVSLIDNPEVKVIDASTAHRTLPDWAYGFPELSAAHLEKIRSSKRVAVPGCHASGFIALVYPLIAAGILPADSLLTCHSITGYSGGGKKMIAQYENVARENFLNSPRQYGLTQEHKHLKEMKAITGIDNAPVFCPIVSDYYSGMAVTVPLFKENLCEGKSVADIIEVYKNTYNSDFVKYTEDTGADAMFCAEKMSGNDGMEIFVQGNENRILLLARYDNLGKGASGAAVECMNILMGIDPKTGLSL
ncbi:MAG: N-acetyl-gamma-glutamyl-phosphate reductase [Acutalibacteraceae bacterium]|nr:N-acetyl-gamma-glutamyl-phosphate reductase [Acutalibacteraceae bacterium]